MLLKRLDKNGVKFYVNAFTGKVFKPKLVDPTIRLSDPKIARMMPSPKILLGFGHYDKTKISNDRNSTFIGEFKRLMKIKPEKRDKKEFIDVCKRVNLNPWTLLYVQFN